MHPKHAVLSFVMYTSIVYYGMMFLRFTLCDDIMLMYIYIGANFVESNVLYEKELITQELPTPLTKSQKKNLRKKQKKHEQKSSKVAFVIEEVTSAIDQLTLQSSDQSGATCRIQKLDQSEDSSSAPSNIVKPISTLKQETEHTDKDILKRIRALRKKLKQIDELEARIASCEIDKPDSDQVNKIAKKEAFLEELESLEAGQ